MGLNQFFESGSTKEVGASHADRVLLMLAALDTAQAIDDMDIPGSRLHKLKVKNKRSSVGIG